jgi:hypothetical protein
MQPRQPSLHRHQQLLVSVATPSAFVVEVAGVPYYVTCLPNRANPPTGDPLRPGDRLRIYNTPGPHGPTLVERLTPDGTGDGCTYLLRDYDRVAPASSGTSRRGRAHLQEKGAARPRGASGRASRRAKPARQARGARLAAPRPLPGEGPAARSRRDVADAQSATDGPRLDGRSRAYPPHNRLLFRTLSARAPAAWCGNTVLTATPTRWWSAFLTDDHARDLGADGPRALAECSRWASRRPPPHGGTALAR